MGPSISVIVPTFNRSKVLYRTLPKMCALALVSEVIVLDDCSQDATPEVVARIQKDAPCSVRYYRLSRHMGSAHLRNLGVSQARCEHILTFDDDMEPVNNITEILYEHLIRNKADIIAPRIIWEGQTNQLHSTSSCHRPLDEVGVHFLYTASVEGDIEVPILPAVMLARRQLFEDLRYDTNYRGNAWREETDFQIRASARGYKLVYCPSAVVLHLPKELAMGKGGQRERSRISYEFWVLRNNWYFAKKNLAILRKLKLGPRRSLVGWVLRESFHRCLVRVRPRVF